MRVAVNKMEGVTEVDVSLNRGLAVVRLAPKNGVRLERIRQVIRDNGFTPKDAEVRVRGTVRTEARGLILALPDSGPAFRLAADPQAPGVVSELRSSHGQVVTIVGRVPDTAPAGAELLPLEPRTVSADS